MRREVTLPGCGARAARDCIRVGGVQRLSTVDWPGQLAAVVFCQGCGWRCRYCHNPDLISFGTPGRYGWNEMLVWLERRRRLLDAIVFSGGEPTLQPGILEAVGQARALGFKIGLHTAGPSPGRLSPLLALVDWVGFDFKGPFPAYGRITGHADGDEVRASLAMLRQAGVDCEVRTTWHSRLLSAGDLGEMAGVLSGIGCTEWVIQRFRPDGCGDVELRSAPVGSVPLGSFDTHGVKIMLR
jgi:pyruvate formate lyase activating enzyme